MIFFSKYKMGYAMTTCLFFGITIGLAVFASDADVLCPAFMDKGSTGLCYVAIGASAAGIAGIAWPFLPHFMHAYIGLVATMPGGSVFNTQMALLAYKEALQAVRHIQALTLVPLQSAECLREETAYSMMLVRRSLFGKSHVDDMNRAINETANTFEVARRAQDRFRDAVERGFRWLEEKGVTCRQTLIIPGEKCLAERDLRRHRCYKEWEHFVNYDDSPRTKCIAWYMEDVFLDGVCGLLKTLGTAACGIFSEERITESLLAVRDRIANWMSNAIRMRIGMKIEIMSTNYVADELASAWAPFIAALNTGSKSVGLLYDFVTIYLTKYFLFVSIIIWPLYYMVNFYYGSLSFDNKYILEIEQDREYEKVDENTPDELRFLPLQPGIESETIRMVPQWIPMPDELSRLLKSFLWGFLDLLIIFLILLVDFFYTKLVDTIYYGSINLANRYQGSIFNFVRDQNARGLKYIGQMLVEQLDKFQQAAGLGRMIACAQRAPVIDYTYTVFVLIFALRLYYHYFQVKLAWIPSVICTRFNGTRYKQRLRALKAKTLQEREEYQEPEVNPMMKAYFNYCCGCCTWRKCTPYWFQSLFD